MAMKTRILNRHHAALLLLLAVASLTASAQTVESVSALDASQSAAAGGGGDSGAPVISPDGRYVLFASAAGNLVLTSSNTAMPCRGAAHTERLPARPDQRNDHPGERQSDRDRRRQWRFRAGGPLDQWPLCGVREQRQRPGAPATPIACRTCLFGTSRRGQLSW